MNAEFVMEVALKKTLIVMEIVLLKLIVQGYVAVTQLQMNAVNVEAKVFQNVVAMMLSLSQLEVLALVNF